MTYNPGTERVWRPLAIIMAEGLWFLRNLEELEAGHGIWINVATAAWIGRILPEVHKILQDPAAFEAVVAHNEQVDPGRDRVSAAYSPRRDEYLSRLAWAFKDLRDAVVQWSTSPSENWEVLEASLVDILRDLHSFDPVVFEGAVKETQSLSPGKEGLRP
jgi:hypothetical protein